MGVPDCSNFGCFVSSRCQHFHCGVHELAQIQETQHTHAREEKWHVKGTSKHFLGGNGSLLAFPINCTGESQSIGQKNLCVNCEKAIDRKETSNKVIFCANYHKRGRCC